jgi:hypothetical protein
MAASATRLQLPTVRLNTEPTRCSYQATNITGRVRCGSSRYTGSNPVRVAENSKLLICNNLRITPQASFSVLLIRPQKSTDVSTVLRVPPAENLVPITPSCRLEEMKCLLISFGLLTSSIGLAICAPVATAHHQQPSHHEARGNAADADPYTKLCGEVALTIEDKVSWTGSAKRDADAALVVFRGELVKIDASTAPAGC